MSFGRQTPPLHLMRKHEENVSECFYFSFAVVYVSLLQLRKRMEHNLALVYAMYANSVSVFQFFLVSL